ncbi:hypothetical protein IG631_18753 [Alternaria alternata]|nr:hypothetical protein IG631_18753 [Alternaria alternata]
MRGDCANLRGCTVWPASVANGNSDLKSIPLPRRAERLYSSKCNEGHVTERTRCRLLQARHLVGAAAGRRSPALLVFKAANRRSPIYIGRHDSSRPRYPVPTAE